MSAALAEVHEFKAPFVTELATALQAVQDFLSVATKNPALQAVVVASALDVHLTAPALALAKTHGVQTLAALYVPAAQVFVQVSDLPVDLVLDIPVAHAETLDSVPVAEHV